MKVYTRRNIASLGERVAQMSRNKKKVSRNSFRAVLEDCSSRILRTAKNSKDEFILYNVPPFIFGYPMYNQLDCVAYIKDYMIRHKMPTGIIPPYTLCIAWNPHIDVASIVQKYIPKMEPDVKIVSRTVKRLAHFESICHRKDNLKKGKSTKNILSPTSKVFIETLANVNNC